MSWRNWYVRIGNPVLQLALLTLAVVLLVLTR